MATTVARLQAVLDADTRSFTRKMHDAETKTEKFGHVAKAALVSGVAAGFTALGIAAKIGWDEFNAGQRVAAQTNAVLKSTGGAANVTAQHVEDLGLSLMNLSGVDDEVIKQGENVLLTFTKIRNEAGKGNDIFDQTTKVALDMSTALGQDLQSSIIQVGKALQNPTIGLTALRRVGVSFTDQQTAMIEKLAESGHQLEAQKMILAELTKEFGGTAKAAGETFGGQLAILHQRLNNFLGDLVGKAIPALQRLTTKLIPKINELISQLSGYLDESRKQWDEVTASLNRHRKAADQVVTVLGAIATAVKVAIRIQLFWQRVILQLDKIIVEGTLQIIDAVRGAVSAVGRLRGVWVGAFKVMKDVVLALAGPIFTIIHAVERLLDLLSKVHIPGGASPSTPSPHNPSATPSPHGFSPRGTSSVTVNVGGSVIAERDLYNLIRNLDDAHRRRGGR